MSSFVILLVCPFAYFPRLFLEAPSSAVSENHPSLIATNASFLVYSLEEVVGSLLGFSHMVLGFILHLSWWLWI